MRGGARFLARALPAQLLGEDSEGAAEAPSERTLQMGPFRRPTAAYR